MKIKKIFLQVLVAVLIATGMKVTANADTIKGKCGDNCRYSYNTDTKELVISGTGDITDKPWVKASYFHKIKKVTIKNGITALKVREAFGGCRGLETVHMAESVKEVAVKAFSDCVNLKTLTIPGVEVIDRRAFYECSKLSGVEFSKSIRKIGGLAFCGVGFKGELVIKKGVCYGSNVTKLRLISDKTISKRLEKLFLQPFLCFNSSTNRQICICLKKYMKLIQLMLLYIRSLENS